jgi:hypothetical protein
MIHDIVLRHDSGPGRGMPPPPGAKSTAAPAVVAPGEAAEHRRAARRHAPCTVRPSQKHLGPALRYIR